MRWPPDLEKIIHIAYKRNKPNNEYKYMHTKTTQEGKVRVRLLRNKRDKPLDDRLIYKSNEDKKRYPFCKLHLLVYKFRHC